MLKGVNLYDMHGGITEFLEILYQFEMTGTERR